MHKNYKADGNHLFMIIVSRLSFFLFSTASVRYSVPKPNLTVFLKLRLCFSKYRKLVHSHSFRVTAPVNFIRMLTKKNYKKNYQCLTSLDSSTVL